MSVRYLLLLGKRIEAILKFSVIVIPQVNLKLN